jgi:hypothetical protein
MRKLLLIVLALAAALQGCAIVPYDAGYHGDRHYRGDGYYRYHHHEYNGPYGY